MSSITYETGIRPDDSVATMFPIHILFVALSILLVQPCHFFEDILVLSLRPINSIVLSAALGVDHRKYSYYDGYCQYTNPRNETYHIPSYHNGTTKNWFLGLIGRTGHTFARTR
jgi:hypothetical protein